MGLLKRRMTPTVPGPTRECLEEARREKHGSRREKWNGKRLREEGGLEGKDDGWVAREGFVGVMCV
eukprot:2214534-Rhodomonas_salina.1